MYYPLISHQGINTLLERHGFKIIESNSERHGGFFFVASHHMRFLMRDPRKVNGYDSLLYVHAMLCYISKLDKIFKLEYPYIYRGRSCNREKMKFVVSCPKK